ncbi:M16 family metallopeptidase [Marinigracilibium pacificum]|uniref:Insulinase family protein n=1 Tax=Marinigracilibium pacificum TaxID=2729599 RepID=A0A848IXU3_9BACT|nr:pitrilysin family protein [Marinigracilibium pacificum]NMM47064.1 insulinase family protein [Marinigracilibium pacificum]
MSKTLSTNQILAALLFVFSFSAFAQTKLVEKVEKKDGELVIPYSKFKLKNGLTLIVHEDHSDPLVHVDVTYHVGSAREELKKSGFAHFFEHMMFQGSENVADEEHFKIVTESGGTLNGTTNRDRTNYFETVPSNQLETMLWLEADRMGYLLPAVTQEKFEVQRETVKNEKQQRYDNAPYGLFRELQAESIYPYGHPYSWLTIGKLEDLDRVDVEDLKKFFLRWYGPNNAVLTVGGDVDTKEVVKLAEKYFGTIPAGPAVEDLKIEPVKIEEDRYTHYEDKNIRFPALIVTFPTVPAYHEDEAALDYLSQLFGTGKKSFFYKEFVKTQKAIQASAFHSSSELAGEMTFFVLPYPGRSLSDFEAEMRTIIFKSFEEKGVSDDDIEKIKASYESNFINGLTSVSGKVSRLAAYETFTKDADYIGKDLKRYLAVTKEDVMRVYNKYIKGKSAVYLSVVPDANTAPAKADNYEPVTEGENTFPTTDYSKVAARTPKKDSFDRSSKPASGKAPLVPVPNFWTAEMDNGIEFIGTKSDEVPTVAVLIEIKGGARMESNMQDKAGIAQLTASLMNESTENYTAEEIQEELRKLGSSVSVSAGSNSSQMVIQTLSKNLDKTLELAEEILYRPKFTEEEFNRLKKQQFESVMASLKDPSSIASNIYDRLLYGEGHIYSLPTSGNIATLQNITLEDVKAFYEKNYSAGLASVTVVGDVEEGQVMESLSFLKDWKNTGVSVPELPATPAIEKTTVYFVDKADAPQSQIRVGYVSDLKYDVTGPYFKTTLMNYPLGGAFNSRINLNLREDKGWTYGARSYFSASDIPGPFTVSAGIKGNATDSALVEIMSELKNYADNGITNDELEFMKQSVAQRDALKYETPFQKAGYLSRIQEYDLPKDYVKQQAKIINSVTAAELNGLAKKYIPYDKLTIVIVGDKKTLLDKVKALGYNVVEWNPEKTDDSSGTN